MTLIQQQQSTYLCWYHCIWAKIKCLKVDFLLLLNFTGHMNWKPEFKCECIFSFFLPILFYKELVYLKLIMGITCWEQKKKFTQVFTLFVKSMFHSYNSNKTKLNFMDRNIYCKIYHDKCSVCAHNKYYWKSSLNRGLTYTIFATLEISV